VLKRWAALPRGIRWVVGGAAALIVILAIAWVLFVPIADGLATHDVGQVAASTRAARLQTARDAARGRLLTLGAGIFAAVALLFTARTFALSREGQVTDRYTKAIDQLGSAKPEVRTGAMYALDRVIRDSPRDHHQVMAVLAAYLRQNSDLERAERPPGRARVRWAPPAIQAAMRVIGHRDTLPGYREKEDVLNLTGVNLTNTDADKANLSRAWLHYANFTGTSAPEARFIKAQLRYANFTGANLADADFTRADLREADLTRARHVSTANFTHADLTGALWPADATEPEGWQRDTDPRRLKRAKADSGGAAAE
jgi:hypothetical protein